MLETLPSTAGAPQTRQENALARLTVAACAAVQFLSIVPPLVRRPMTAEELGRSVGFFPLVGIALGAMLAGIDQLAASLWPPALAAVLVLGCWVLFTGALHLDGFLDTCDGVFGGHTPETRLRILRDERVGAYAVIGGVLLLMAKYQALVALGARGEALVLASALGRLAMVLAIVCFPYARLEGLGRSMKDVAGWRQVALASIWTALALCWCANARAWLAIGATLAVTLAISLFCNRRLQGLTGDVYGAVCEMSELGVLLVFAVGGAA
jgi:adenosylcobinamide-GDP ribazoletransferase